jgi:hypothetical protein
MDPLLLPFVLLAVAVGPGSLTAFVTWLMWLDLRDHESPSTGLVMVVCSFAAAAFLLLVLPLLWGAAMMLQQLV